MSFFRFMGGSILTAALAAWMACSPAAIEAADHRDAPTVDGLPEGDITDVYAFLDSNDPSKVVLVMNVNPFTVPGSNPGYRYSSEFLYQFKIDNTGDAVEDLVIPVQFVGNGVPQTVQVFGPSRPAATGARTVRPSGPPTISGSTGQVLKDATGQVEVFTGLRDDPFVFDVSQFFRILNGSQDVFRAVTSPALGALRGRPVRSDGTSGVDTFGGFNVSTIAVELPKAMLRGTTSKINVWATVSRPAVEINGPGPAVGSSLLLQFERMGQQAFNTVFGTTATKDAINNTVPADDIANYSSLVPDTLTTMDNDGTGNTIAGRLAVLNAVGVTSLPNGAPLLLPATFVNTNKNLLRVALLPDVLRLDLDLPPGGQAIGQFGLQNGRRLDDDAVDIALRLVRQLADVKFPNGSGLPGSGPLTGRAALDCSVLPQCPDRRVLIVLQGTDFIKTDATVPDVTTTGNDRPFMTAFPFLATPHPLPGDTGTVGFPVQQ
ncbi:MAG TPA: DUF4331 family protein [Bryobacteraceae bacterium]|nr:DUF4331 family protein [Bryobacteraceae bacterium]